MKKIITIVALCWLNLANAQDMIYGSFLDEKTIRKIEANGSTGQTTGSFSHVKDIIASAALGMTTDGYLVYLQYGGDASGSGDGKVDIWATSPSGIPVKIANNFDVNGGSNSELGFVRLGVDNQNNGWILSKELNGDDIYLAKFAINGTSATSPVRMGKVSTSDNSNNSFQNGDLCFDGKGNLYALANIASSSTKMYIIKAADLASANASSTTPAQKKWELKTSSGQNFQGRVNGCAFSSTGSMFVSTDNGLYYIDQFSTNFTGTGTVSCIKVKDENDLSDLATQYWPANTDLPVRFEKIHVQPLGNNEYKVTFKVVEAEDVDSFYIEFKKPTGEWVIAKVIAPDAMLPNKEYKVIVSAK